MIAITRPNGHIVRTLNAPAHEIGFHSVFGWMSDVVSDSRARLRESRGKSAQKGNWLFRFALVPPAGSADPGELNVRGLKNCEAVRSDDGNWVLKTPVGEFHLRTLGDLGTIAVPGDKKKDKTDKILGGLILLATLLAIILLRPGEVVIPPPVAEIEEPIEVKIVQEKTVVVQAPVTAPKEIPQVDKKTREVQVAVKQNLGFIGLAGQKNLKDALGGIPTDLKDVSPGAGAGGKEGSGGESLVGLGEGVRRTSVGNTGVQGLGGIGTKGRGGGAGGYGNSAVGSGTGSKVSAIPLSQDLEAEGGLDRAVILATIAKYLSQVRACYEEGLRTNPGINGQVTVKFEIGGSGMLNYSRVDKTTLGHPGVESCITTKMMTWQFPKTVGGVNQKASYPFLLRPVS